MSAELRILTLNCWGLPIMGTMVEQRFRAIRNRLSEKDFDIVVLQEVWGEDNFKLLRDCMPHSHYFYGGLTGCGLCVLSNLPILDVSQQRYLLNGYPHRIFHGDWFGAKSIAMCQIKVKDFVVNVYTTHAHADYRKCTTEHDMYGVHRITQIVEAAEFIKLTSHGCDLALLAGDLNTHPDTLSYKLLTDGYGFIDAQKTVCPDIDDNKELGYGVTFDRPGSRFARSEKDRTKWCPRGERIDYILYSSRTANVEVVECSNCLTDVPGETFTYSDHEGLQARFRLTAGGRKDSLRPRQATSTRTGSGSSPPSSKRLPASKQQRVELLSKCRLSMTESLSRIEGRHLLVAKVALVILALLLFVFNIYFCIREPSSIAYIFIQLINFAMILFVAFLVYYGVYLLLERKALMADIELLNVKIRSEQF